MSSPSSSAVTPEVKSPDKAPATARTIKRQGPFSTHVRQEVNVKHTGAELAVLDFPVSLRNQNYALLSYVGPNTIPASGGFAIRIYGTFASYAEAEACAVKAMKNGYNLFDLDIVDIQNGFFPLPPPPDSDVDLTYSNDKLAKIMQRHKNAVNNGSRNVVKRAESDEVRETVEQQFESRVTSEALQLFKEWKKKGRADGHKTIKQKVGKRYGNFIKDMQGSVQAEIEAMPKQSTQGLPEGEIAAASLLRKTETETELS